MVRCVAMLLVAVMVGLGGSARGQEDHPIIAQVKPKLKDVSKPFTMLVLVKLKEGNSAKFETAFAKAVPPTRKEKGCIAYDLNRQAEDSGRYMVYERWKNLAALEAHLKTTHITTLLGEIGELMAEPPEVRILVPVDAQDQ